MTISHNLVTNVSAWFFWNMVNIVDFSVIHVSQGSVATYVRCGEMSTGALHSKFPAESVSEIIFSARQHAERDICYRKSVCPSVRLSVCHTGGSVENG